MQLLGSAENKITKKKKKNGENVPHFEITEVILVHCYIVNNDYQQDSKVLYMLVANKSFGQLLDVSPKTQKPLIQNLHIQKFGLQIKFLSRLTLKIK